MKLIKHAAIKTKAFPFCLFVFSQLASVAVAALVALFLFGECCFIPFQYCSKSANICRLLLCCKAMLWTANMLTGFLEGSRDVHGRENPLAEAQHGGSSYFLPHLPLRHCKTCPCTLQELCAHWKAPSQRPGSLLSVGMGGSCLHADFRASRETEVLLNLMTALLYSQDRCSVSRMCGGDKLLVLQFAAGNKEHWPLLKHGQCSLTLVLHSWIYMAFTTWVLFFPPRINCYAMFGCLGRSFLIVCRLEHITKEQFWDQSEPMLLWGGFNELRGSSTLK